VRDAQGTELPFPDNAPWRRHLRAGGEPDRAAWRRAQVDALVERLAATVHAAKPWVRVGVSPFGLPRPDRRPAGIEGFSQYDKLHADVERWLAEGWLDYLAPQLYWPIGQAAQAFAVLQDAWRAGNPLQRHIWPGLFTSRLGAERTAYDAAEVLAQVELTRHPGAVNDGHLHFSMIALLQDRDGIATRLRQGPYAQAALTPATPWLDEPPPRPPVFDWRPQSRELTVAQGEGAPLRQAVLWIEPPEGWRWQALPMPADKALRVAANARTAWLIGIGRSGLESRAVQVF
jgi:uncharacterized lipoprotein YddW (UPF0748 family)